MKIIFKIFIFFLIIIFFFIGYLSFFGFETKRFNKQIISSVKNIDNNFEIKLKEIKIVLDLFNLQLNAKTIGSKLIHKNESIEIEYLKTQIPLSSLLNRKFLIKNIEISTKSLKIKNLISFVRKFQNSPELFLLEKIVKKGFLIADIKIDFDENGKIKNNLKIKGILKDAKISVLKTYKVEDFNLIFNYNQNALILQDLNFNLNNLKFFSKEINIKNLKNQF